MTQLDPDQNTHNSTVALNDNNAKGGSRGKNFCKKISKFLFSHIGLVVIVIVYAVLGGFLFELLEQHKEIELCEQGKGVESGNIVELRSKLLTYIQFNITSNPAEPDKDNETIANQNIESWLQRFRNQTNDVRSEYRYTGNDCNSPKWNFPGALLFAITCITTIGYGNITPVTWEGQIVCICYATIGIPFFLMCIANISGVLGDMFRFVYARICCRLCYNKKKPAQNQSTPNVLNNEQDLATTRPSAIDIAPTWGMDTDMNGRSMDRVKSANEAKVIDDPEAKLDEDDEEKVTVPLTVTMIIITAYIGLGAFMFHTFEEWTLVEAGYFCYITLATIGFGDFVPGQRENDPYAGPKLIAGAIYVLFGMAILAMCFDLMQEEIIAKFTWLGKKMGIVEQEQAEDDAYENYTEINDIKKDKPSFDNNSNHNNNNNINGRFSKNSTTNLIHDDYLTPRDNSADMQNNQLMNKFRSAYLQNMVQRPPTQKP